MVAAVVLAARPTLPRGGAATRRLQHRAGDRRGGRRRARLAPGVPPRSRSRDRRRPPARSATPPRATSSRSRASSAARGRFLVFADCDLEAAARKAAGQYDDAGQVCLAGTRLLVEEPVAGAFLELFHRFVDEHVLGDPRDDATTVSPLIHRGAFRARRGFVERARAKGDEIVRGGRPADRGGLFYEPTLVLPRSNESEIVQREVFGPVLTFQRSRRGGGRRARELDAVRPLGDRLHRLAATRGAGRAARSAPAPYG